MKYAAIAVLLLAPSAVSAQTAAQAQNAINVLTDLVSNDALSKGILNKNFAYELNLFNTDFAAYQAIDQATFVLIFGQATWDALVADVTRCQKDISACNTYQQQAIDDMVALNTQLGTAQILFNLGDYTDALTTANGRAVQDDLNNNVFSGWGLSLQQLHNERLYLEYWLGLYQAAVGGG